MHTKNMLALSDLFIGVFVLIFTLRLILILSLSVSVSVCVCVCLSLNSVQLFLNRTPFWLSGS